MMNYFDLRQKNLEQLIAYMRQLGLSYVPKWQMTESDPDPGTALAFIFADMYSDLIKKAKHLPDKHYVDFLNLLEPSQKPSDSARGYVVFSLSEGTVGGVPIARGKQLLGVSREGENLFFETQQNILLSPSQLEQGFLVSSEKDAIERVFSKTGQETSASIEFMQSRYLANLQKHELWISHEQVLSLKTATGLEVIIVDEQNALQKQETIRTLSSGDYAKWQYFNNGIWKDFDQVSNTGSVIYLKNEEALKLDEPKIRVLLKKPKKIQCQGLRLRPISQLIEADVLYQNELEIPDRKGLMFGRQFMPYDCFYIGCDEVFSKAESFIEMRLDYILQAIDTPYEVPEPNIQWKHVLKKNELRDPQVKNLVISDLTLEYWNGIGWSRLETLTFNENLFTLELDQMHKATISFKCPKDMARTNVGAHNSRFIRLRILQVENAYALLGKYHAPNIQRLELAYHYAKDGIAPSQLMRNQFLRQEVLELNRGLLNLFNDYGNLSGEGLYLCFNKPLVSGPLRLFFELKTQSGPVKAQYVFQMLIGHKWVDLEVIDDTNGLSETGVVTFIGSEDHSKTQLFDSEGYWLRILEVQKGSLPSKISRIELNGVLSLQQETVPYEYFTVLRHEYDKDIKLLHQNIDQLEVWVNEPDLSEDYLKARQIRYEISRSLEGLIEALWVKWDPITHFGDCGPEDRVYLPNCFEGRIRFGNAIKGALPESRMEQNVRVGYAVNQGDKGNVSAGAVNQLAQSIPNVNRVFNPCAFSGGKAPEDRQEALSRVSEEIHHLRRIRSTVDLEDLIKSADYDVRQVVAISGVDPFGSEKSGHVTCALLPKKEFYEQDYFLQMRAGILEKIAEALPCTLVPNYNLWLIEPHYVTLDVHFRGKLYSLEDYMSVYQAVEQVISDYLEPETGNRASKGWLLGNLPDERYLLGMLQRIEGLESVERLIVSATQFKGYTQKEVALTSLREDPFVLIQRGSQHIVLET